jgi:hypothetical protein
MEYRAAVAHKQKKAESLTRTIDRYEGTMALMASWEQSGTEPDTPYLRKLRIKAARLRTQLRMKGLLTEDGNGTPGF